MPRAVVGRGQLSPRGEPTLQASPARLGEAIMSPVKRYRCDVCGYVHEGSAPPDVCPVCGVGSELFSPLEEATESSHEPTSEAANRIWRCTVCGHLHEGDEPPDVCPICAVGADLFVVEAQPDTAPTLETSSERIVIIGAGGAGLTAAEHVRKHSGAQIVLINKEPHHPYNRLSLTRFLAREIAEPELFLKSPAWYAEQQIQLIEGEVTRIDRGRHLLELRDGSTQRYDRLILANGAHPFIPPIVGAQREGVTPIRTIEQAKNVLMAARPGTSCVVIGGGLLGLEAAAALNAHGVDVTVLEGFGWLLPRQLAEPAGQMLAEYFEQLGVTIQTGASVAELFGDEAVRGVQLKDNTEIAADLVIIAAGVRPNKYLALQAELETNRGVVVDDDMATSDPYIFAAGDTAEHRGVVYGLWPVALGQGAVAGANAAGVTRVFTGTPPANQLKVLDLPVFSIGQFNPTDAAYTVHEHRKNGSYRRLVCHDGKVVGANLLGDIQTAGALKEAVERELQLADLPPEVRALLGPDA
jgi:nitrite reductase (NADH) large subunit